MKKLSLVLAFLFLSLCAFAESAGQLATYTYNLVQGWNLIGLTLNPTAESEQELLGHKIYEFNGDRTVKNFCQAGDLVAGRAYWIFSDQNESLVVQGTPVGGVVPGEYPEGDAPTVAIKTRETPGEEVTVTVPEKEGYTFTGWTVEGVSIPDTTVDPIVFTMPDNSVSFLANYSINKYMLTVDDVPEEREYGSAVSVVAEDREGYGFVNWTVEGVTVDDATAKQLDFAMPANDVTLTRNYTQFFILTVNGTAEVKEAGEVISLTAEEKDGKTFGGWWNLSGVSGLKNTQTVSFAMPANDVSLDSYYYDNGEYLVVNLETGESRTSTTSPDLSDDTCRTTELWLRKVPAGTFMMGSPADEMGRLFNETRHQVTLTEEYYIGVFEMTQKQYELIAESNPSDLKGDTRPVERVSYDTIRGTTADLGAGWPTYGHAVDDDSLLGKLRAKTGLAFDLPTEAQWEYACRAGTTTALNTGKNLTSTGQDTSMDEAGRYYYNSSDGKGGCSNHTKVGSYLPNAWGLYDMLGNVFEWCLDWNQDDLGSSAVTDPEGPGSGDMRLLRGGAWNEAAQSCRSARRFRSFPLDGGSNLIGFRVCLLR